MCKPASEMVMLLLVCQSKQGAQQGAQGATARLWCKRSNRRRRHNAS